MLDSLEEVMTLEEIDPGIRCGQIWQWTNFSLDYKISYLLLKRNPCNLHVYNEGWTALQLESGEIQSVYSVGVSSRWKRIV